MSRPVELLSLSQYEDAAAAVIEPGLEPEYSNRLRAATELLDRAHARNPQLETPIIDCAGPSPQREHRDTVRAVLAVLR